MAPDLDKLDWCQQPLTHRNNWSVGLGPNSCKQNAYYLACLM
ncbi:hypothetical protein [Synechococcus sp. M16CYN]